MLNLSKTGGDHSAPASDRSAGGHTNVEDDDDDDLDEDDDNISDGEEDDIKDHGKPVVFLCRENNCRNGRGGGGRGNANKRTDYARAVGDGRNTKTFGGSGRAGL